VNGRRGGRGAHSTLIIGRGGEGSGKARQWRLVGSFNGDSFREGRRSGAA
jgi:hypothetical protein